MTMLSYNRLLVAVLLFSLMPVANLWARNIDLATVPAQESVQLTIYNSEDITLVRETRTMSFKKGDNPLQFSWANTLIDASSVELRFPNDSEQLEVLDTTFPHDKPQQLYWNVASESDIEAQVEISYFTSGITWSADYIAIAGTDEQSLQLESFIRVENHSGEGYHDAEVRVVVGVINLVERIAELARVPAGRLTELGRDRRQVLRRQVLKKAMQAPPAPAAAVASLEEKVVAKEGLSEYFIYTIEGTETIANGWTKRLRSFAADAVPLVVQYRYRPLQYGEQLVRLYLLRNDETSGLGTTPLPNGQLRVFRDNGRGGLSYVAAQQLQYVPIGDRIELNLGPDPEVLFELIKLSVFRDNLWLKVRGGNVYRQYGQPGVRIAVDSTVAGWDEHQVFSQRLRNFTDRTINVQVRRAYRGDVVFRSELNARLHDYQTVEYDTTVAPGQTVDLLHQITQREGYNRRQNRVVLDAGTVQRR